MKQVKQSRRDLFERLDRPALLQLPSVRYEFAEWKKERLPIYYHIRYDDHFYSAHYSLTGQVLWCRGSGSTIEIFHKGKRVASHVRSFIKYECTTDPAHRPANHAAQAEWTPERIVSWGKTIGPQTALLIGRVIADKPHPEQGYRSALGIIRLADQFTKERLEIASEKALLIDSPSYMTVQSMLKRRMESAPLSGAPVAHGEQQLELLAKENIRGPGYYH